MSFLYQCSSNIYDLWQVYGTIRRNLDYRSRNLNSDDDDDRLIRILASTVYRGVKDMVLIMKWSSGLL